MPSKERIFFLSLTQQETGKGRDRTAQRGRSPAIPHVLDQENILKFIKLLTIILGVFLSIVFGSYTGCFFGVGALVFEKVLSCETRGPILRNRGPIQRNTVSLNRTAHS